MAYDWLILCLLLSLPYVGTNGVVEHVASSAPSETVSASASAAPAPTDSGSNQANLAVIAYFLPAVLVGVLVLCLSLHCINKHGCCACCYRRTVTRDEELGMPTAQVPPPQPPLDPSPQASTASFSILSRPDLVPCIICMSYLRQPVITNCGHMYCYRCISKWLVSHNSCPMCRAVLCPADLKEAPADLLSPQQTTQLSHPQLTTLANAYQHSSVAVGNLTSTPNLSAFAWQSSHSFTLPQQQQYLRSELHRMGHSDTLGKRP